MKVTIEISARHVHLSKSDLEILFGKGFELSKLRDLSQTGQFASEETVRLIGPGGEISKVRVLGPCRAQTQIEMSETEARALGLNPPVRDSGNLSDTPGIKIIGPVGEIITTHGVILALRHIHIDPAAAANLGVKNYDRVKVDTTGTRDLLFENVLVRVDPSFKLAMHIDTDEANAAGIDKDNHEGEIVVK
ncbi:MAG: phosphate propanoyltransferase [bacterium]|nr:phosphate propanoyltransferase [bacterium]